MTAKLILVMIAKNEEHVLERALRSALPLIDTIVLIDTGSTDRTKDIAVAFASAHGLTLSLRDRPWVSFGHNRSEALALAREAFPDRFALTLDADDWIEMSEDYELPELTFDQYDNLVVHGDISYAQPHVIRLSRPFYYEGSTHEYLHCLEPVSHGGMLGGMKYRIGTDGQDRSSGRKFKRDIELLSAAVEKNPYDGRGYFYLAQSYRDDGQLEKALETYQHRAAMPGWDEENYLAKLEAGKCAEALGRPWTEVVALYLEAHESRAQRAEAMYRIARYFRIKERYELAYRFGLIAIGIPRPNDRLFVEDNVYSYQALDETAIAASYLPGLKPIALNMNRLLLDRVPDWERPRIERHIELCGGEAPALVANASAKLLHVSVVIPCFRQAQYLGDAVRSVLSQTYKDFDVIIAAGDAESEAEARKYEADNVRVMTGLDHGLADARNKAIEQALGPLILPLDADDLIAPTFLAKTVPFAEDLNTIVGTQLQEFGGRSNLLKVPAYSRDHLLSHNQLFVCSLFSKRLWELAGGYDVAPFGYEDWSFWVSCFKLGARSLAVPEPLFLYRIHESNGSNFCYRHDGVLRSMLRTTHRDISNVPVEQDLASIRAMPNEVRHVMQRRQSWFPDNETIKTWLSA